MWPEGGAAGVIVPTVRFNLEVTCLSPLVGPPGSDPDRITLQGTLTGFPESPQPHLITPTLLKK